jgi:hypothetical protein
MSEMVPTALSCPLGRAPESQNKSPEGHMTPRMPICDPRAQPAITITKARPHSHDIHAAMLELGHRSAPPEHSCHRNADIALAEASSLLNTRPVTASALLSTIRLPNLATCTRLEALQDSGAAFGHQHNGHEEHSMCCTGHGHAHERTGNVSGTLGRTGTDPPSSRSCPLQRHRERPPTKDLL